MQICLGKGQLFKGLKVGREEETLLRAHFLELILPYYAEHTKRKVLFLLGGSLCSKTFFAFWVTLGRNTK